MNNTEKLNADIQRVIKYDRADHNGIYDGLRASKSITEIFINSVNKDITTVAGAIADYWMNNYILNSTTQTEEPTQSHINWLLQALEFLQDGTTSESVFSKKDWIEIKDIINSEAETLPIDLLTSFMSIFMEQKIL